MIVAVPCIAIPCFDRSLLRSCRLACFVTLAAASLLAITGDLALGADYRVYYLGGQSNMDGYGKGADLPAEEREKPIEGAYIFHGNTSPDGKPVDGRGVWAPLRPGHGVGFRSDGKANQYSDRFGVELTFVRELKKADPAAKIAVIKYSRGGTSIDSRAAGGFGCWEPDFTGGQGAGQGINQYDHFLATIRFATSAKDIDGDGTEDRLIPAGIVWMQGESDATNPETAAKYEANLKRLMDLIRASLREDDLPVTIGRISDSGAKSGKPTWPHGETVRKAQADFVSKDGRASLVESTDNYGYSDPWHYDSAGYLDLGKAFAESLQKLKTP